MCIRDRFYDADIPADIVTFDYKGNYDEIIKALKKQGKMDRRTKMYNVSVSYTHLTLPTTPYV
ncbi:hypothetical protein JMUB7526_28590 [Staphylococcus aureus]